MVSYSRKFGGRAPRSGTSGFFKMGVRIPASGMTANKIHLNFNNTAMVVHVDDKVIAKTVENWEDSERLYKMALFHGANKALLRTQNYLIQHQAIRNSPYEAMAMKVAKSLSIKEALGGKKFTLVSGGDKLGIKSKKSGFLQASALQTGTGDAFGLGRNFIEQKLPWAKFFEKKGRGKAGTKGGRHGSAVPLPPSTKGGAITQVLYIYEDAKLGDTQGGYAVVPKLEWLDFFGLAVADEAGYRIAAMTHAIAAGSFGNVKMAYNHFLREKELMRHQFVREAKKHWSDGQQSITGFTRTRRPKTADMTFKESLKKRY